MTEDGSEMASTNKNSNETRLFINRELSVRKSQRILVNVRGMIRKSWEVFVRKKEIIFFCDEAEMCEKTKLTYLTNNMKEDDVKYGLEDNLKSKSSDEDNCGSKVIVQFLPDIINTPSVIYV